MTPPQQPAPLMMAVAPMTPQGRAGHGYVRAPQGSWLLPPRVYSKPVAWFPKADTRPMMVSSPMRRRQIKV